MICNECETVAHCANHGCIPKTSKKDEALAEQPAQQQEPVAWRWVNSKGWLTYGEQPHDKFASTPLYTSPPASKPLTPEQIDLLINGRGDVDDADYVEPTGDGFGLTDADLVCLVRRVEAAHGIKGDA